MVDLGKPDARRASPSSSLGPGQEVGASAAILSDVERRRGQLAASRARSERLKRVRRAMPWVILGLAVLVGGWIGVRAILTRIAEEAALSGTIHIAQPRFYGRDTKGKSYLLRADEAIRDAREPDKIALTKPVMKLDTTAPTPTTISSQQGQYREQSAMLYLYGQVLMQDQGGYRFRSEHAVIDTRKGVTNGDTNVTGEGPLGRIAAAAYSVYDGGAKTVFKGGVRGHLYNNGRAADAGGATRQQQGPAR